MDGRNRTYAGSSEFEALLLAVDKATSNTLFQPDWEVNRVCVEGMNLIGKPEVAYEIGEEIQKKLKAPESRVVILTLHLIDSFVNECGQKWHVVMNDKGLCDEIVRMALRYVGKGGSENVAVVDACSDLVQSWGEAFLPHRKQYPNIVEMYISLRNVGFPFKSMRQHDFHHAPGYHPPANFHHTPATDADAALAASLQASLNVESARERSRDSPAHVRGYDSPARLPDVSAKSRQGSVGARHYAESPSSRTDTPTGGASGRSARPSATRPPVPAPATSGPVNPRELMESLLSAANLLRDLIRAATTSEEISRNELAADIAAQIQTNQSKINIAVDQCMNDGQLVERLFRVNDDSQSLVIVYQEIRNGRVTLQQGKQKLNLGGGGGGGRIDGGIATAAVSDGSSHRGPGTPQRMVPTGGGGHHGPPPTIQVPPAAAAVVQQAPRPPPPQQSPTTTRKKGHRADSLEGDLTVITAEPDPFAPQAIDALFDTKPAATNQRNSSKHTSPTNYQHGHQATPGGPPPSPAHPLPPPDIPAKALKNIDSDLQSLDGTVIAAAEDPFAPEALDALFVKKPNPAAPAGQGHYHQQLPQAAHHYPAVAGHHHVPYPTQYPNQAIPVPIPPGYAYPGHQQHPMAHHYPVPVGVQPIQRQQQPAAVPAMPYAVPNGAVVGYPYGQQPMTSPNHHPAHHAQIAQPQMPLQVQVPPQAGGSTRNHTAPNSTNGSPTQHAQHQQAQQQQQQQQQGGRGFDPFSPAALDALFTGPTVTPANHRDHHHPPTAAGGYPAQLPPPSGGGVHHRAVHLQQDDHHSHRGSGANSGRNSPARFMNTADAPSPAAAGPGTGSNKVDPFSPDALDAMLGLKPPTAMGPGIADPRVNRPSHPNSHAGSRSHSPRASERVGTPVANMTGHTPVGGGGRDPFSPEALDALFDAPSSAKSVPTPGRPHATVPPSPQPGHGHYHGGAPPQQAMPSQQYHAHHASPQISPHGNNAAAHYFPNGAGAVPAVPMPPMGGMAMPPPGMIYVAGPNGMVYAAPANVPPPPGYYPLQTYPMVSPTNTNNMPSVPHPVHHS